MKGSPVISDHFAFCFGVRMGKDFRSLEDFGSLVVTTFNLSREQQVSNPLPVGWPVAVDILGVVSSELVASIAVSFKVSTEWL